jgi:hypothetical protein
MYETLTGAVPFQGDKFEGLAYSILETNPVPPHELNPAVEAVKKPSDVRESGHRQMELMR